MASDTDIATPERATRRSPWATLKRLFPTFRRARPPTRLESPSLLRRRRSQSRRYSPLTRRILLLNIVPVVLLALGAVYLSDYEDELIDAELASLLVQGEMVAAGIGEVAVIGGETTVNRLDAEAAGVLPLYGEGAAGASAGLSVLFPPLALFVLGGLGWLLAGGRRRAGEKYAGLRILR